MWNHIKFIHIIKSLIPLTVKLVLVRVLFKIQCFYYGLTQGKKITFTTNSNRIFVLLSTDYSNLGDHAITFSHILFLKKNFPKYEIVEVLVNDTIKSLKYIKQNINSDDIITLKGGGNIGIEYFREELIRRKIIQMFKFNKIISFPQTAFFPQTKTGKKELLNTIGVFNSHVKSYYFFRDEASFDLMKKSVNNAFLTPDIVLSLPPFKENENRNGVVTCLRSDVEGIYSRQQHEELFLLLKKYFNCLTITDTIKDHFISTKDRTSELNQIWNCFSNSKLVITDRLHGMIFAALTRTPCIVFKTYNYKLTGQYSWLKHLNYIRCIDFTMEQIEETILDLLEIDKDEFQTQYYQKYFKQIIDCMRKD